MKVEYEKGIYRVVSESINGEIVYFIQIKKTFLYFINYWSFSIFNVSKKNETMSVLKRHIKLSNLEAGIAMINSIDLKELFVVQESAKE